MTQAQKRLQQIFADLPEADQQTLLAFAEFLASRDPAAPGAAREAIPEPRLSPRPQQESVVAAMKRLKAGYFMLEHPELLTEATSLMTQHVMQGREAGEVIDELEALFLRFYEELVASHAGSEG